MELEVTRPTDDIRSKTVGSSSSRGLTFRVLGVDWSSQLPLQLRATGFTVESGRFDDVWNFLSEHYAEIYRLESQPDSAFLAQEFSESKTRYYREAGDFFVFKNPQGEMIGAFTGTIIDWSSYYFRNCSILPRYQGLGLYQELLQFLIAVLSSAGVHRVEGDIAPSNLGHIHVLNKLGFNITGLNLTERWGSMLHFTKFLSRQHEAVFLNQFCHGPRPQLRDQAAARLQSTL